MRESANFAIGLPELAAVNRQTTLSRVYAAQFDDKHLICYDPP
jgi:hypothetical protein